MRVLESLSVDEYYQTISTWLKIIDDKNEQVEKMGKGDEPKGSDQSTRKRFKPKQQ